MRVLIVDDEPHIRRVLRAYLEADGLSVDEAANGREALAYVTSGAFDVVLLDVGLPDIDGLEVLRQIRAERDVPVILVTARAEEVDTLVGLAVGADDYIVKPFRPREVVARTRAVLRRVQPPAPGPANTPAMSTTPPDERLVFAGLVIDTARREVDLEGSPVTLSALQFDLLVALARSPGRVWTRSQLLKQVWGYEHFGGERVVDVHVRSIRRRLYDDAADPRIIGTVRGVGYKFLLTAARET